MRKCGECTACCTVNAIVELKKPQGEHCSYECEKGCSKYWKRPQSCRDFHCMWILGHGDESGRPDKIGLFVEDRLGEPLGQQLFVKEAESGASTTPEGEAYLQSLHKELNRPLYLLDETMQGVIGVMR